ncbi:unnamed protein product, partial [Mesorhabditis spiculigera]
MFLLIIFTALLGYALYQYSIARKLPSGPLPFLFLGNLPQLYWHAYWKGNFAKAMRELQKRHGDVHTIWLGMQPFVNICTLEKAKELFVAQGKSQIGRFVAQFIQINQRDETGKTWGIVASHGETWTEHRRFALHTLRNFGMGKNIMEGRIIEELDYQLGEMENDKMINGEMSVGAWQLTDLIVGSIINRILFGYRFDKKRRDHFFAIKHNMDSMIENMTPIDVLYAPWWKNVPILKWRHEHIHHCLDPVLDFVKQNVMQRVEEIENGKHIIEEEPEDFMDAYFLEQKRRGDDLGEMSTHGLIIDLHDLWLAGQETTNITLQWSIHLMIQHPEIMKKCQDELSLVTAGSQNLSFADRPNTPYFTATSIEVQRVASILNFNLWRTTQEPCQIAGNDLPLGTLTTAQLSLLLGDPEVFERPDEFDPSRFLGEEGKKLADKVTPFGLGKRSCPGESLARNEIYLILGNLLLRYDISGSPKNPPRGDASPYSLARGPAKYDIVMKTRKAQTLVSSLPRRGALA